MLFSLLRRALRRAVLAFRSCAALAWLLRRRGLPQRAAQHQELAAVFLVQPEEMAPEALRAALLFLNFSIAFLYLLEAPLLLHVLLLSWRALARSQSRFQ